MTGGGACLCWRAACPVPICRLRRQFRSDAARRRPKVQQKAGERRRNETGGQEACEREVIVNGETCSTAASTLADLIEELGYGERRIATAVNG